MPRSSLAVELTLRVAAHLGHDVSAAQVRDAASRLPLDAPGTAGLVDAILEVGQLTDVAWRRHALADAFDAALLADLAAPAVVVVQDDQGLRAVAVWARGDGRFAATVFRPEAVEEHPAATAEQLVPRGAPATLLLPTIVTPLLHAPGADSDDPNGHATISPLRRLGHLLAAERGHIVTVYLYATLVGLFSLAMPVGVQAIIGLVSGGLILQPVVVLIAFVVGGTLVSGVLQLLQLAVVERIQQRLFARLALEFSFRVPRLQLQQLVGTSLPEQMNRFFEVVTIQKSLAKLLTETSIALLQVLFGLVLLTVYHPYFSLFSVLLLGALVLVFRISGPKGLSTSLQESKYKYRAVHWLEELGRAITAFKFAGRSNLAVERMDEHVTGYLRYRSRHFQVLAQQTLAVVAFKTIVTGGLLILGSMLVINRQITLGQFVASEIVIVTVLAGVEKLILSLSVVYDILTAVEKLGHVSDVPLEPRGGAALPPATGGMAIRATGLGYTYPDAPQPSLVEVGLHIAAGERIGITGAPGAGQTTLLRVLLGLQHGYQGTVTYDGVTLRDLDGSRLRADIGQCLSSTDLFDGTIEENVAVGRPHVDAAEVRRALTRAGCYDAVQQLPRGVRTVLANGGRDLPGRLVARLLLAQALAGAPRLITLDDFIDGFDVETRTQLAAELFNRENPWTVLLVTRDPALLSRCDRVVVLDQGRVHAQGSWAAVHDDPIVRQITTGTSEVAA